MSGAAWGSNPRCTTCESSNSDFELAKLRFREVSQAHSGCVVHYEKLVIHLLMTDLADAECSLAGSFPGTRRSRARCSDTQPASSEQHWTCFLESGVTSIQSVKCLARLGQTLLDRLDRLWFHSAARFPFTSGEHVF